MTSADWRNAWLAAAVFALLPTACATGDESHPNIVIILADDLGLGDVRSYTNRRTAPFESPVETPAIDRIAAEGMRFTNAHSPSAVCSPTRYALLTGRYAWRTHLKAGTVLPHKPALIAPDEITMAELLREAGYATAMFGKWHLGLDWQTRDGAAPEQTGANVDYSRPFGGGPVNQGFDTYFGEGIINFAPFAYIAGDRVTEEPNEPVHRDGQPYGFKAPGYEFEDVLPKVVTHAVGHIRTAGRGEKPLFVYLSLSAPHAPIVPPERIAADSANGISEFARREDETLYNEFIRLVDWSVEQVLDALETTGLADNTIVIFSADNGVSKQWASHDYISPGFIDGVPLRGQKADVYEGGHRVPLLIRWPQRVAANGVSHELVELNDIYRTVAEIVGTATVEAGGQDSISVLPTLLGDSPDAATRRFGVNHSHKGGFAYREIDSNGNEWKLIFGSGAAGGFSGGSPLDPFTAIDAGFNAEKLQLYNLSLDPGESNDQLKDGITEDEMTRVLHMQARLQAIIESGASVRP